MNECPDETALLDFAEGRLQPPASDPVAAHLRTCSACREIVSAVSSTDPENRVTETHVRRSATHTGERTQRVDMLLGASVGEYQVEERIGEGGMGRVYRGVQPVIGKAVAIKVIRPDLIDSPGTMGRLIDEARAANAVGHRNIIDIFSFGTLPSGEQYFVMEYLIGAPLSAHLVRSGALPVGEAVELLIELVSALAAAHAAGVVHRDLKPSNLFLVQEPDGKRLLKVLDFGIAKLHQTDRPQTRPGILLGTPEYMAPEQVRGEPAGPECDLYAVGVIAYQMLTARRPFTGGTTEVLRGHLEVVPQPVSALRADLPEPLSALVSRLLSKEPGLRGRTDAVREELEAIARELSRASAPPVAGGSSKAQRLAVSALVAVVLVVGGLVTARELRAPSPSPPPPMLTVQAPPAPVDPAPEPVEAPPSVEPEPTAPPPPPAEPTSRSKGIELKLKRAELLQRVGGLRRAAELDATAQMLLDDVEKRARAAQSYDELRRVERQLEAVRDGYVKKR